MSNQNFRNLVFEGGGVKGIAYGGALQKLENMGVMNTIERVAGTSAGAITAVLLALGYNADDTSDIVATTNFADFADDSFGIVRDAERFLKDFGWHKGEVFKRWIGNLIKNKTGIKTLTFAQLKALPHMRDLYIIATNLSDQVAEVFSYETTPNMEIREAARMSMGIPLYFQCVRYGTDKDIMVDGGIAWNYPLNLFDNKRYLHKKTNGEKVDYNDQKDFIFNHETLGFRLDSLNEIEFNKNKWANIPKKVDNILTYASALVEFMHQMANKKHLHKNDWNRTVFINTLDVQATDFSLSLEKIDALIANGEEGVSKHFAWREKDCPDIPS